MLVLQWEKIASYLVVSRNFKDRAVGDSKSKFKQLSAFLSGREMTEEVCDEFIIYLSKHYAQNSVHAYISLLRHIAVVYKLDWVKKYKYPRKERKFIDVLTSAEIKKLAETYTPRKRFYQANNYRYKVAIYTLATTGLRISELTALTYDDIKGDRIIIRDSKNGDARVVPLLPHIAKMILKLKKYPHNFVFGHHHGAMDTANMNAELKKRAELAGITKNIHNHLFRHSFITECMRNNENPFKVAQIVGHRKVETTLHYTHMVIDDLIDVVKNHPLAVEQANFEHVKTAVKKFVAHLKTAKFDLSLKEYKSRIVLEIQR